MASRRDGIPTVVTAEGVVHPLERLSLQARDIDEGWLQTRLFQCPEVLPINEIDPSFGPLIPIGREIGTAAGPIDNLYVSPQGTLTIVEAKLWRNPQARREVIGQILDYAKEISGWSYDDIDARAKEKAGKSLWELVRDKGELDESKFVDAVSRNMRSGAFLLLVVGDGIREEMESLTRFIQENNQLRFTLALVELQLYKFQDGLLVIPSIVARTAEITRAVVHVRTTGAAQVDVSLDIIEGEENDTTERRSVIRSEEFFQELSKSSDPAAVDLARRLYEDFSQDSRFQIDWGSGSYQLKLRDPANPSYRFTMLVVQRFGTAYVGWLPEQLPKCGMPADWGYDYFRDTASLLGMGVKPKDGTWERSGQLSTIGKHYSDFKALIERFADQVCSARTAQSGQLTENAESDGANEQKA
jgi:hypothetical protein